MIVTGILLVVFGVVSFALWREGFWGALVMLLAVVVSATAATAWFEVLAGLVERPSRPTSYTYLLDFLCLWGLFCGILLAVRELGDRVSRTRVRFRKPVELFGTPLVAALAAWVMVCFTAASLHTAPLPRAVVQPTPEARMFFGLAPDRRWLAWVRGATRNGPFARPDHAFDEDADFVIRYAERRARLEAAPGLRVAPR